MMRRWMVLAGLWLALMVATPVAVRAQEPDPCTVYAVGTDEWRNCYAELREANMRAQRQQLMLLGTGALVFVALAVSASAGRYALRMRRGSGELRTLMTELVPPEAQPLPAGAVERSVRSLTTIPIGWYAMVVPLLVGIAAIFYLSQTIGYGPLTWAVMVVFIGFIFVAGLVSLISANRAKAKASEWLQPLGLRVINLPEFALRPMGGDVQAMAAGSTVLGGTRFGRQVTIRFSLGTFGRPLVTTNVQASVPLFEVGGENSDSAYVLPSAVSSVLDVYRPLDRGVQVRGDADGITIERQQTSGKMSSAQGIAEWLRDLRLAEQLAAALTSESSW